MHHEVIQRRLKAFQLCRGLGLEGIALLIMSNRSSVSTRSGLNTSKVADVTIQESDNPLHRECHGVGGNGKGKG